MANKQRLGRAKVRSHPACIYVADEECLIKLYVPSKRLDGDGSADNPEVVVRLDAPPEIPYGDENSPTLPFDVMFPVFMQEGQELWVVSPGESEVSFTALPAPLNVVGY